MSNIAKFDNDGMPIVATPDRVLEAVEMTADGLLSESLTEHSDEIKKAVSSKVKAHAQAKQVEAETQEEATRRKQHENELSRVWLANEKERLALKQKWEKKQIKEDAKAELADRKRINLIKKYSYLYDMTDSYEWTVKVDGEFQTYKVPNGFSFSKIVNRVRQFTSNYNNLNGSAKKLIKASLWIGGILVAVWLFNKFNVLGIINSMAGANV